MSTKTSIKRIALVAVAALGFGMVSTVSANAAVTTGTAPTNCIFAPSGATCTIGSGTLTTSTAAVGSTAGWTIQQTASAGGYTQLDAKTNYAVAGLTNIVISFTGVSSLTSSGATATYPVSDSTSTLATTSAAVSSSWVVSGATITSSSVATATPSTALKYDAAGQAANALVTTNAWGKRASAFTTVPLATGYDQVEAAISGTTGDAYIRVPTTTAGTITGTVTANVVSGGVTSSSVIQTFTIIVNPGDALAFTKLSTAAGSDTTSKLVDTNVAAGAASGTASLAEINAKSVRADGVTATADSNAPAKTFTISGVGQLSASTSCTSPTGYVAVSAATSADTTYYVCSDTRSGVATVTVSAGGSEIGKVTVYIYGKVAKVSVAANYNVAKAGGGTLGALDDGAAVTGTTDATFSPSVDNDPALAITLTDAAGNVVPTSTGLTMSSSNAAVIQSGLTASRVDDGSTAYTAGFGVIHATYTSSTASKSGDKADLTFSFTNSDGTVIKSAVVPVTIGGAIFKEVITTDKASYDPGEAMTVTITATDKSGNPVYDGQSSPLLKASKAVGGSLPSEKTYVGGVAKNKSNTLFAPALSGDFVITGTGGDAAATALSVSVTVTADSAAIDAANEATEAANAATDAANAAAEAADAATAAAQDAQTAVTDLAAQVATLMAGIKAQITRLTNLIVKIQKKVKA